jgi:assimilatory nitrate reductase electron transfer subunit
VTTRQVLIVGYGMAGARLAEELRRRDPVGARLRVTVLGAEPDAPYNRVLLAEVLSGALGPDQIRLYPSGWPHRHQITAHRATAATTLDPARREVTTADGTTHHYDDLVLATGAHPRLPSIPGLTTPTGTPSPGVTPLRTLTDTRHLLSLLDGPTHPDVPTDRTTHAGRDRGEGGSARADGEGGSARATHLHRAGGGGGSARATQDADRGVVVLGGGVLGLEAARALAGRGVEVTLVHPPGHVMNRQLDRPAGRLLGRLLRSSGIRVLVGEAAARWEPGEPDSGTGRALVTDRGTVLPCRALVVAAGAVPDSGLAREAGIAVRDGRGGGGIVVDDRLATSEPGVWAIGDCAWHEGAPGGFVAPAWEQAAVLADLLSGTDPAARYRGSRVVTRLKDRELHLTTLGDACLAAAEPDTDLDVDTDPDTGAVGGGDEVVVVSEGARGRYVKLVVRDGKVAGAILLGVPDAAAGVVQLFDRGDPVPADRLAVALGRAYPSGGTGDDPVRLADGDVVCRCNSVTKGALVTAWRAGATGVAELATATRATTGCGSCGPTVAALCAGLRATGGPGAERRDGEGVA